MDSVKNYLSKIGVKESIAVTVFGIVMLFISLFGIEIESKQMESLGMASLITGFIYGTILSYNLLKNKEKFLHLIPFLFLSWFIGCFCTNVLINIFENFPIWVYIVTFLFCLSNYFIYSSYTNRTVAMLSYFVNGFSVLLILYYAVYLIPILPYSFIGIVALGLGFYGLVPLIVLSIHLMTLSKLLTDKKNKIAFVSGLSIVIMSFLFFTIRLNNESSKISSKSITNTFENNPDLPSYITVSQNLSPNIFNEILLKKDLVYVGNDNFLDFGNFNFFSNQQYNERKTHNPFINLAYYFTNDLDLSVDDRINILKSNFDKRLETEEQLWSGDDLFTKNIKEDVKIFPESRLAYTEITMDIACDNDSWGQKEAIYSFQLPENSIATSLSLWVNGMERKGVLTTKEKAQAAYKQIVKVEARDPSLMQWKEGNKVVVRIFPISRDLPRTFKCGFTTPMKVENNTIVYQSLHIKGPNISNAKTLSRIQVDGNSEFKSSKNFELKNNYYINSTTGLDNWNAVLKLNNLPQKSFVWKDKEYQIEPIEQQSIAFTPSEIVLDINKNWTSDEVEKIISSSKNNYYVFTNNKKNEINSNNYKTIIKEFEDLQYSLLPLFLIKENSLIITKNNSVSANFEELESSNFLKKIKNNVMQKNLKVINISVEINPFWQTLKEQNFVNYYATDLNNCIQSINQNKYTLFKESENTVNLEPAKIAIHQVEKNSDSKSNGPDHIYRMYAFGKVLNEFVENQNDSTKTNHYVNLAEDANIVTPISSLIVLETDDDYKKNGIEKNVNTLGNASINNDGSVPEPYEWAMILLGLTALFIVYKKR
jgi:XrtN system VIT domain protein